MLDVQIRTEQHASAGDSMDCFLTHGRGIMAAMCMHGSRESRRKKNTSLTGRTRRETSAISFVTSAFWTELD